MDHSHLVTSHRPAFLTSVTLSTSAPSRLRKTTMN